MAARQDAADSRLIAWVPAAFALATVLLGLVDIVSAVTPERAGRLHRLTTVVPLSVAHAASAATAVTGMLLILLGHGLRRRKRRAWRGAVALLLLSTGLHVTKGLDGEEAIVTFIAAVMLLLLSRQFYAAGDPRTRWRAPAAFVSMLIGSTLAGVGLIYAQHAHLRGNPSMLDRLQQVWWGRRRLGTGALHDYGRGRFRVGHSAGLGCRHRRRTCLSGSSLAGAPGRSQP